VKYILFVIFFGFYQFSTAQQALVSDSRGRALKEFYLSLGVETHWLAGAHINWETGEPDDLNANQDIHTHCSAFVAAACKKLNIYILRPPEHPLQLLSNAQYDWLLSKEGRENGWMAIDKGNIYYTAQEKADQGYVVICIYKSRDQVLPGHIAFVRPAEMTNEKLTASGPMLVMAGTHNFNYISLKSGFGTHISGWPENEIRFYFNTSNRY
jgi:hypothetical protein